MGSRFINGAKFAVSTSLAAAVVITAISNASPAVASTATPPADGSILVLKSGWPELNETVARSDGAVAVTSFQIEGVNSTDVTRFPAGEGAGTFEVAGDFVSLSQVRDIQTAGGEQNFFNFKYVEDQSSRERQKPTSKSAASNTYILDYDPELPWYDALIEIDRVKEPVVLRETLPNGDLIYYYGYLSFNKVPTKTPDENMTVSMTFSLQADPIRYAA